MKLFTTAAALLTTVALAASACGGSTDGTVSSPEAPTTVTRRGRTRAQGRGRRSGGRHRRRTAPHPMRRQR